MPYSEDEGSARTYTPEQIEYFRQTDSRKTRACTFAEFDEWFTGVKEDVTAEIELCAPGAFGAIYPTLARSSNCGRYIVFSGHRDLRDEMLRTLQKEGTPDGLRTGANVTRLGGDTLEYIKESGFYEVGLNDRLFTADDVKLLADAGVKVFSNLGDYPEWWEQLQTIGAAAFKTNYSQAYTQWYLGR